MKSTLLHVGHGIICLTGLDSIVDYPYISILILNIIPTKIHKAKTEMLLRLTKMGFSHVLPLIMALKHGRQTLTGSPHFWWTSCGSREFQQSTSIIIHPQDWGSEGLTSSHSSSHCPHLPVGQVLTSHESHTQFGASKKYPNGLL